MVILKILNDYPHRKVWPAPSCKKSHILKKIAVAATLAGQIVMAFIMRIFVFGDLTQTEKKSVVFALSMEYLH